jgi:short-subunit dehydrogenase
MRDFAQQTALVTGASSGIGEAFARALAARGAHLVLAARTTEKLEALAAELSERHGIRAVPIAADLARPGAGAELAREVERRGITIDALINNAGFATYGPFEALPAERERDEVQLNVAAVVDLSHAFFPGMVSRRRGAIVNVASTAAFTPLPYMAVYGATKAFVLSFSEALWFEGRERGVAVLALCPGPTETAFFDVANANGLFGARQRPEVVVERALWALARGRSYVVPGLSNALLAQSARFAPRSMVTRVAASMTRPRRGRKVEPAL